MQGNAGICNEERASCEVEWKRTERTTKAKMRSDERNDREKERLARKLKGRSAATNRKRERATISNEKSLFLNLSPETSSRKNHKTSRQKVRGSLRSSACITEWLHNSSTLCNELYSISGKERRGRSISAIGNAKNFHAIIHEIGWRDQTHLKKRTENIRENYTPERATRKEGLLVKKVQVIPEIYYGPGTPWICCWNFADSKWKGVDFHHLAKRNGEWEKEQGDGGKVTTRAAKRNGWRTGEIERRACEEGSREEELASANAGSQFVTVRRLG